MNYQVIALQHLYYASKQGNKRAKQNLLANDSQKMHDLTRLLNAELKRQQDKSAEKKCCLFPCNGSELTRARQEIEEYSAEG